MRKARPSPLGSRHAPPGDHLRGALDYPHSYSIVEPIGPAGRGLASLSPKSRLPERRALLHSPPMFFDSNQPGARQVFQPLEKKFPIIGKSGPVFPAIGKLFSNQWKNSAGGPDHPLHPGFQDSSPERPLP